MSQTSIERLKDYLVQLPPQSQALLMREFERAIERGEDTTVATLVLEQLRKVVRGADEDAKPRTDDPARLLFRPLEPFLVEGHNAVRPGQVRRSSLSPGRRPALNRRSANSSSPRPTPSSRSRCPHRAATSSARWPASVPPM
jgi:hypothetical protein